METNTIKTN